MSAQIAKITEEWIVDTEEEAKALIEETKAKANDYELTKYSTDKKEKKSKGEVIATWYVVKLTKVY